MVNPHDKLASDTVAKSLKFVDGHCVVGMPWKVAELYYLTITVWRCSVYRVLREN